MSRTENIGVMADGCFDPLHYGHIRYLAVAAELGGLTVNVAPDDAIRAKGRQPFQLVDERMRTVKALKGVTLAITGSLSEAIARHQPKYLVKGAEWAGALPPEVVAACRIAGTTIVYADTRERSSTERLA